MLLVNQQVALQCTRQWERGTEREVEVGRGNWLLKHIVNRLHNELRLLFETGGWKLRRKCNRRDVEEERKATRREEERRKREGNNSNESYEIKLLNQMN